MLPLLSANWKQMPEGGVHILASCGLEAGFFGGDSTTRTVKPQLVLRI